MQTCVFATTHIVFLVYIYIYIYLYVATKNATYVFTILVANYIGVFDTKLS
jgi:hypothetical protein